mmetsp:Transcript_77197/g.89825  ORF Transcript_77197/g.89825 Transcript_77197/m.89825 type:complete len:257 (+) Transcript_77197:43-813(+)
MGCGATKEASSSPAAVAPAAQQQDAAKAPAPAAAPVPAAEQPQHHQEAAKPEAHPPPPPPPAAAAAVPEKENIPREDRKAIWVDLKKTLPRTKSAEDKQRRVELWQKFDKNQSNRLSLAEVDASCRTELGLDKFTSRLSSILARAFNKANGMGGKRGSGDYVEFLEFRLLLCYVYDYFELQVMFDEIDSSQDGRITLEEFKKAAPLIEKWGLKMEDPEAVFREVDTDKGGVIHFAEFAAFASEKKLDADGDPDNEQ